MNMITPADLPKIIRHHQAWLRLSDPNTTFDSSYDYRNAANIATRGNITRAQLQNVDLSEQNLTGLIAKDSNLSGANFRAAQLDHVDLKFAKLISADLHGASLSHASLSHCDLQHANLLGADLTGCDLRCADLRGARFDINITRCWSLSGASVHVEALPWVILYPAWPSWGRNVRVIS